MKHNWAKVFKVFSNNYELVPLEVFGKNSYKTLISTLISARTQDEISLAASNSLFKLAPNIKALSKLPRKTIQNAIHSANYHPTKAKHIKALAIKIITQYSGKVPDTKEDLQKLPGVGIKTANLVLNRAFAKPAIAVDTHVHRISNLLGWVKTKTPEQTEKELERILPKKYWKDINRLFVSIGRQYRSPHSLKKFLDSI